MATERSLGALLRSLQAPSDALDGLSLLPTATTLLAVLKNPLNITLLASQLLAAPAIWDQSQRIDLHVCRRIISVFNTAAMAILQNEESEDPRIPWGGPGSKKLDREQWVKAVVSGADEKSPRWRHILLIGGVLLGFEGQDRQGLPWSVRKKLESALVTAAGFALEELEPQVGIDGRCVTMVMNYTFELLSDLERARLDYDRLLPVMVQTTYFSPEGFEGAYFLGSIDQDIVETPSKRFAWPPQSSTFQRVTAISGNPLISALGPLSRFIAHAVENVQDPRLVARSVDQIADFVRTLMVQWRQNKLSEVDKAEEVEFLEPESLRDTIPTLWKLLRNCLYSVVIVLRSVLGRVINDRALASDKSAPFISMQALHILRNLYFISSRVGPNSSSQHIFVTLAAVDILAHYRDLTENFLKSIKPSELGQIPAHPLDRCLDLYFLNTAELFATVASPKLSEDLFIQATLPYLAAGGNNHLLEIFEAAHSLALVVFAIHGNAAVAAKHLPFYVDNLFAVFPTNLSGRQFRLAFKTVLQVTAPPSPIANRQPLLPSILLEVLYDRALNSASSTPLPPSQQSLPPAGPDPGMAAEVPVPLSEQAILALALIDSLCFLRVEDLEEWLPLTANLINAVSAAEMRRVVVGRFWDALSSGEMDVERAHYCVTWWSTRGGREIILFGGEGNAVGQGESDEQAGGQGAYMSGAVGGIAPESKL
ncbi:putative peroxisomal membrane protein Pex17 [Aspergillus undulatus]|uniref:putative peroxisomal membrane protein Pex17 n=1 Tax=Aspergillus undulatus TaxID=1810928 RepID=UPI003CCDFD62